MIIINSCGNLHVSKNKNNQDFYYRDSKVKVVLDGCSLGDEMESSNTEVGAKLFSFLFSQLDEKLRHDESLFEDNVKSIFDKMLGLFGVSGKVTDGKMISFLSSIFSFTILAAFELEEGFVVKTMGDGFIIMQNKKNDISYMRLEYEDNSPPYYIYNYLLPNGTVIDVKFETYRFSKDHFVNIGVASDGIAPFAIENNIKQADLLKIDRFLLNLDDKPMPNSANRILSMILQNKNEFHDDTTIVF